MDCLINVIFPSTSATLATIGLSLDIAGVMLLFKFGLPAEVRRSGHSYLRLEKDDEEQKAKATRYDRWSWLAMTLLVVGFVLQLMSSYF